MYFVVVWYQSMLSIAFSVTTLALRESYDCPSASEATMNNKSKCHCNDVIMSAVASQITGVSIVCSTVGSGANQRKHQSSASLAFVRGIHRWPLNSPHKRPLTRKMFSFDDAIMHRMNPPHSDLIYTTKKAQQNHTQLAWMCTLTGLFDAKSMPYLMLTLPLIQLKTNFSELFLSTKCNWKCRLNHVAYFVKRNDMLREHIREINIFGRLWAFIFVCNRLHTQTWWWIFLNCATYCNKSSGSRLDIQRQQ